MSDHSSLLKPTTTATMISSLLGSPRFFFNGFFAKSSNISDHSSETVCNNHNANLMSPTSILDTKNSSTFKNPFGYYDINSTKSPTNKPEHQQQATGLALIDSFIEGDDDKAVNNRTVLFGSKLKVQIPVLKSPRSSTSPEEEESPKSPADFGIKTRNVSQVSITPTREFSRQMSLKEMELSEDYTCVITHGPNPKTTHIYDDCVVESTVFVDDAFQVSDPNKKMEYGSVICDSPSANFMSFCHTCKQVLRQDRDIFIYRGEKAFCSEDCRCQEMVSEGVKNPEFEWCFLGPSK